MTEKIALSWAAEFFNGPDLEVVRHAYEFALEAHDGQLRASGEPYVIHCVEVGRMLAELGIDSVERLFENIPDAVHAGGLDLPGPVPELTLRAELAASTKDQAELSMIVDLLRN